MARKTGFKSAGPVPQRLTFGNIPEENTLHYLSGRVIKLADPEIVKQFDALERSRDRNKEVPLGLGIGWFPRFFPPEPFYRFETFKKVSGGGVCLLWGFGRGAVFR